MRNSKAKPLQLARNRLGDKARAFREMHDKDIRVILAALKTDSKRYGNDEELTLCIDRVVRALAIGGGMMYVEAFSKSGEQLLKEGQKLRTVYVLLLEM